MILKTAELAVLIAKPQQTNSLASLQITEIQLTSSTCATKRKNNIATPIQHLYRPCAHSNDFCSRQGAPTGAFRKLAVSFWHRELIPGQYTRVVLCEGSPKKHRLRERTYEFFRGSDDALKWTKNCFRSVDE